MKLKELKKSYVRKKIEGCLPRRYLDFCILYSANRLFGDRIRVKNYFKDSWEKEDNRYLFSEATDISFRSIWGFENSWRKPCTNELWWLMINKCGNE